MIHTVKKLFLGRVISLLYIIFTHIYIGVPIKTLSKKLLHIENNQSICIINQSTYSYTYEPPAKGTFWTN